MKVRDRYKLLKEKSFKSRSRNKEEGSLPSFAEVAGPLDQERNTSLHLRRSKGEILFIGHILVEL